VLSSPSLGQEAALAIKKGAEDHVAKPFDVPALVERIRQALESPRPRPDNRMPCRAPGLGL
jgi:CheY-like chemotaxis protein